MFNPLCDKPREYIVINGEKHKVKTDFDLWIKLIVASSRGDMEQLTIAIADILGGIPTIDISQSLIEWINQFEGVNEAYKKEHTIKQSENRQAFCFDYDGDVIFAELWHYYPAIMTRKVNYHEGVNLIQQIIKKSYNESELARRAFARCGDFSKMEQKEREHWLKLRNEYMLPNDIQEQEEKLKMIDALFYNS